MPRSRKDAWLRDELILALDLYRREGRNPSAESVRELSEMLRSIPLEPQLAEDPVFRNEVGVRMSRRRCRRRRHINLEISGVRLSVRDLLRAGGRDPTRCLPEAIGSASAMDASGTSHARIRRLWIVVALICTLATVVGFGIADTASGDLQATINGFAAGALLVMLVDSMIPDATRQAGNVAGLVTVLGFAVAAALSSVG